MRAELNINFGKRKLLSLPASERSIFIRDKYIKNVDSFTYPGSELAEEEGAMKDIEKRICKAQ